MDLIRKLLRTLRQWLLIGEGNTELAEAKRKAIGAVGRRNTLRRLLRDHRKRAARLEAEAGRGLERGATAPVRPSLGAERARIEVAIAALELDLEQTEAEAAGIRGRLRQILEVQVCRRTTERLSRIAWWRQANVDHAWRPALRGGARDNRVLHFDLALVAALILLVAVLSWLASAGP
jgi:phage shock protein A